QGNALVIEVKDASGNAVDGADMHVQYVMPAMGSMAEMKGEAKVTPEKDGRYRAVFDLPMAGSWTLNTSVSAPGGKLAQSFSITVGTSGLRSVGGPEASGSTAPESRVASMQYPAPAVDALHAAMDGYDRVRALLAQDRLDRLPSEAQPLAEALRAAVAALPKGGDASTCASAAAAAAERIASAKSLDDARKTFAELSTNVIALVGSDARLQEGWHVFECPMFEGHPRWMQRAPAADNPYMGTKMSSCGTEAGWVQQAQSSGSADDIDHYTCSMHPSVRKNAPGTCPICGMNLVPVTKEQQRQGVVTIEPARQQLIGVRTGAVVEAPMVRSLRAIGRLAYDESTLTDVSLKVRGWIVKLLVSSTGQRVQQGQTLFTLYSPELYNAQQDFLLATHAQSAASPAGAGHNELASAARQRLRLLDVSDAQIDEIARRRQPLDNVAFTARDSGFVIEKDVVEGAAVEPGMRLYRIASLNKIWIEADVYEADFANVRMGQKASVTLDYLPGRTYEAKVSYIYPYLNPESRTGRVRLELVNKHLELRPGMYASVQLESDLGKRLQVPASAVVYTGPR
ncbi:MAG TPA: efflux RND transporter periplasmic adaptor subunit, partial [Polyangiaceae bacterium]|nr:efflux RND transporter periplasmic adaptor subunit [Polyangiaceae bacterium]